MSCSVSQGADLSHPPLLQEGAAGVFNILQLQKARANQERLNILLVDGHVATVRKVNQGLQSTAGGTGSS